MSLYEDGTFSDLSKWFGKEYGKLVGNKTSLKTIIGTVLLVLLIGFIADLFFNGLELTEAILGLLK